MNHRILAPNPGSAERAPIVAERLAKHYGPRRVVDGVSLAIPRGSVYGLLGRNGAGKSTFIKMLLGFVRADYGYARLLGHDAARLTPETRSRIAYLAEGHPLHRWMTIKEAARFTRAFYPVWREQFLDQILDHFRLSPKAKIGRLSTGQRAQVSLALALAPDPELLILDDPTLGLDTVVRRDFLESMIQLIQKQGRTILFSSHILGDVERVADRIGILVDGVLRVDCPTERFKESVRRVALHFLGAAPEFPPCAGLVSQRRAGSKLELVVVDYGPAHEELAESLGAYRSEVVELSLEDAFIAYTRGPVSPLPTFEPEVVRC